MTTFDLEAAQAARAANSSLTVFDTGEMLEPIEHNGPNGEKTGPIDFDDSEGRTVATVFIHPSAHDDDTMVLMIDASLLENLKIIVNDGDLCKINPDGVVVWLNN